MDKMAPSDFEDFFKYLHIEPGTSARLLLTNWERANNNYGKLCLRFLVLARDGVGLAKPQLYETRSAAVVRALMPVILQAQDRNCDTLLVNLACFSPGKYEVTGASVWTPQSVVF